MRKDTLYITDLDGTLLKNDSQISQFSRNAINRLSADGAMISFATARTPATVCEIFENVKLNVPGIVMTGASLYSLDKREYIKPRYLNKDTVLKSLDVFNLHNINPFIYTWRRDNLLHAFHTSDFTNTERMFYEIRRDKKLKIFHLDVSPQNEDLSHTLLMFCVGERNTLQGVAEDLRLSIGYQPSYYNDIFNDNAGYLEVFAKGVDKASAVKELASLAEASRIVCFGDNLNDLSMMEIADVSLAVDNAFTKVKQQADIVIGINEDDSVVKWILNDFYCKGNIA